MRWTMTATSVMASLVGAIGASADVFWDQPHDFRDRSPSEENTLIPSARTADDFRTLDDKYALHFVTFQMIVSWPSPVHQFAVDIFARQRDSGRGPGRILGTFSNVRKIVDHGAWNGQEDLHLQSVTIQTGGGIHLGTDTYWLSCYGIGEGSGRAWWGTAGNGEIKGSEGYFMSDHFGVPDWTPISDSGILDFPTDFAFTLDPPVPAPGGIAVLGLALIISRRRRN